MITFDLVRVLWRATAEIPSFWARWEMRAQLALALWLAALMLESER